MKAIIFDLDNTLIDFMKMKTIAIDEAMDAMIDAGLNIPKKEALHELYDIYYKVGLEDPKIFQRFLKKINGGKLDYKALAYAIVAYRNVRNGFLRPYPGTKRTLMVLKQKGLKLAIVTDAPKLKAWIRLTNMKLDDFFDVIVAIEDTGEHKPSRKPFEVALKKLGLKAEECLMVGDMPHKDLDGAKKLGMKTAFAKYGQQQEFEKVDADHILDKIEDLLKFV